MRIDLYTKLLLTVIALALVTIACDPLTHPTPTAGQGPLAGVQVSVLTLGAGIFAFDQKTGEMWLYGDDNRAKFLGRFTRLGDPINPTSITQFKK